MTRHVTLAAMIAATALLTGCGGSDGNGESMTAANPGYFNDKNDSMATRISNARTLDDATTFTAKTIGTDHTFGERHALADAQDITVQMFRASAAQETPPTVVVTLDGGEAVTFGPEHARDRGDGYAPGTGNYHIPNEDGRGGVFAGDQRKWLWMWDGYPLDHANNFDWGDWLDGEFDPRPRKYHIALRYYQNGYPTDMRRVAVIGLETAPSDMPTHDVRALYKGQVRLETYPTNGGDRTGDYDAEIDLVADFSRNSIHGTMHDWENDGEDLPGLIYSVAPATITGNGYTTWMQPHDDCTRCAPLNQSTSTVAGKFYGPYAAETGGTITVAFEGENGPEIGTGIFYTDRD